MIRGDIFFFNVYERDCFLFIKSNINKMSNALTFTAQPQQIAKWRYHLWMSVQNKTEKKAREFMNSKVNVYLNHNN